MEGFACSTLDAPWSIGVERMVRDDLPKALVDPGAPGALPITASGLLVARKLVAVTAWKPERDPAVLHRFGPHVWLNIVLATHVDCWRHGYGRRLKGIVMQEAREAGVVAVTSVVDWRNSAMRALNRQLGGVEEPIITDVEPDPDFCRCILPIKPV